MEENNFLSLTEDEILNTNGGFLPPIMFPVLYAEISGAVHSFVDGFKAGFSKEPR